MSNPTFFTGNLTKEAGAPVVPFRFVSLKDGRVQHADGTSVPYGAVTAAAAPKEDRRANDLSYGVPHLVRVHASQCVVEIETADEFKVGDTVYAARTVRRPSPVRPWPVWPSARPAAVEYAFTCSTRPLALLPLLLPRPVPQRNNFNPRPLKEDNSK